jgi:hypothetical protein
MKFFPYDTTLADGTRVSIFLRRLDEPAGFTRVLIVPADAAPGDFSGALCASEPLSPEIPIDQLHPIADRLIRNLNSERE